MRFLRSRVRWKKLLQVSEYPFFNMFSICSWTVLSLDYGSSDTCLQSEATKLSIQFYGNYLSSEKSKEGNQFSSKASGEHIDQDAASLPHNNGSTTIFRSFLPSVILLAVARHRRSGEQMTRPTSSKLMVLLTADRHCSLSISGESMSSVQNLEALYSYICL